MKKIQKIRNIKYSHQNGACYYCQQPMWQSGILDFCNQHNVTQHQARFFQATAEHLLAKSDGGSDTVSNIVAACRFCNEHRHRARSPRTPERHLQHVRSRLSNGKWHGLHLTDAASTPVAEVLLTH